MPGAVKRRRILHRETDRHGARFKVWRTLLPPESNKFPESRQFSRVPLLETEKWLLARAAAAYFFEAG